VVGSTPVVKGATSAAVSSFNCLPRMSRIVLVAVMVSDGQSIVVSFVHEHKSEIDNPKMETQLIERSRECSIF
jgi:hypothetical protein